MAKIYTPGDSDMQDRVQRIMEAHHGRLVEEAVDVRVLMLTDTKKPAHALSLHGYPCLAVVRATDQKQRAQGLGDALIVVNEFRWCMQSEAERDALIDHELTHIELDRDRDDNGKVRKDGNDRPKLKMRLHDWELGGFAEISERHKDAAPEVRGVQYASDRFGQLFWNWKGAPKMPKREAKDIVGSIEPASMGGRKAASGASGGGGGGGGGNGGAASLGGAVINQMIDYVEDAKAGRDLPPMIAGSLKSLVKRSGGVEASVRIESGGRSVTFTDKDRERLTDVIARGKKKRSGKRGAAPKAGRVKKGGLRR